jgi:hypothetical protein
MLLRGTKIVLLLETLRSFVSPLKIVDEQFSHMLRWFDK